MSHLVKFLTPCYFILAVRSVRFTWRQNPFVRRQRCRYRFGHFIDYISRTSYFCAFKFKSCTACRSYNPGMDLVPVSGFS